MECKVIIGTKDGKSYSVEAKDEARVFLGKKIGDTVDGSMLGLKGYQLKITGGSDSSGFPMRKDVDGQGRAKILASSRTVGYKQKARGVRERRTIVANTITENVSQINAQVVKEGTQKIDKLLSKEGEGEEKSETSEAPAEAPKQEKTEPAKEEKPEAPKEEKSE